MRIRKVLVGEALKTNLKHTILSSLLFAEDIKCFWRISRGNYPIRYFSRNDTSGRKVTGRRKSYKITKR